MHDFLVSAALSIALVAGCASNATSIDGTDGMVAGTPFTVADSATMVRTTRGLANVVLSDFADTCSVADERSHPSSKQLTFLLTDVDANAPPSQPGTYPIYSLATLPTTGLAGECGFTVFDATCEITTDDICESGTVTLTRVDDQGYAGTFDVVIAGDHITGSFDSPTCSDVSEAGFDTCE